MAQKSIKPLGYRLQELLKKDVDSLPFSEIQKIMQAVHRIEDIFVSRNLKGKGYEKSGKIAKAKELYEANVRDLFLGSHPYERLRIIYTRERQYANAIRICETYMRLLGSEEEINEYRKKIDLLRRKAKS